jgi:hypothetical protein
MEGAGVRFMLTDRAMASACINIQIYRSINLIHHAYVNTSTGKVFAVRASSLSNVVRAIARVLHLSNAHSRK